MTRDGKVSMKKYLRRLGVFFLAMVCSMAILFPVESEAAVSTDIEKHIRAWPSRKAASEQSGDISIGTAWPIASGYVVTNNHVVSESSEVILVSTSGRQMRAWAVIRDELHDIAFLEVKDLQELPPALPLAASQARLGASVFTIGFPLADVMGATPKLSDGIISGVYGLNDDPESYQTTVPIQPGNSGGPLINMKGEVVGVVKSMLGIRDETNGIIHMLHNISCVLKIRCVRDLFALLPRQDAVIRSLPNDSDSLEELAERIQASVLIVIAR
jgi:S1-C subfamily serine protease